MTPRQLELARHALGLPNSQGRSYRNRYFIPKIAPVEPEWRRMVDAGWAFVASVPDQRFICFSLTFKGAQLALGERERLDPEDFLEMRVRA